MKKEITVHLVSFIIFFLLLSLLRQYFALAYLGFWLGGLVGTLLPDIDHFIYIYYLRPHELTSQRAKSMMTRKDLVGTWALLSSTRRERKNLVFHNAWFQVLFFVFTFWVLSSSQDLFGKGLVLAFCLHLLVDEVIDWKETKSLDNWFSQLSINLTHTQASLYMVAASGVLFFLGFFL